MTAYHYKSRQRWIAAHGGGWALYFYRDRNDHQLSGSCYVSGILPSMILASPLGVSGNSHFIQEIAGDVCVWLFLVVTANEDHVARMIFLHSVEECKRLQSLGVSQLSTTTSLTTITEKMGKKVINQLKFVN